MMALVVNCRQFTGRLLAKGKVPPRAGRFKAVLHAMTCSPCLSRGVTGTIMCTELARKTFSNQNPFFCRFLIWNPI